MALTSYLWRGTELNDGSNYLVPFADLAFDNRNSVDASYAYRKENTPVATGVTVKEAVLVLPITIRASSASDFESKLGALRRLFDTRDSNFYTLSRKLPHQQYYLSIQAAPREFVVNRLERKVVVTLHTTDLTWKASDLQTKEETLFDSGSFTETVTVNYEGLSPVEPVLEITALTPGNDGPVPLYYRDVTVWVSSSARAVGWPIKIVDGWDTTEEIGGGKMRSDGLDITVALTDGTQFRRIVIGNANDRDIWILPHTWPYFADTAIMPDSGNTAGAVAGEAITTSYDYFVMSWHDPNWKPPSSATVYIDNEAITYSVVEWQSQVPGGPITFARCQITARGVYDTTEADHSFFQRVRFPTTLRIGYGYASGWERTIGNDLNGWPLLDYAQSSNTSWVQSDTYIQQPNRPLTWLGWVDYTRKTRNGEELHAVLSGNAATGADWTFKGTYVPGSSPGIRDRIFVVPPENTRRQPSSVSFSLTLQGGSGSYPSITVRFYRVRSGFNTISSTSGAEVADLLYEYTHSSSTQQTISTGTIDLDSWYRPGTHYFWTVVNVPPGENRELFKINSVTWTMDQTFSLWPVAGSLGSEGGIGNGEFPVYLSSIQNESDSAQVTAFSVYTRLAENDTVVIDCNERTVQGAPLQDVSYKNPIWLRLVPGNNSIKITAPTGIGQVKVKIKWRNAY